MRSVAAVILPAMPFLDSLSAVRRSALHVRLLWLSARGWSSLCLTLAVVAAAGSTLALVTTGQLIGSMPAAIRAGWGSPEAAVALRWLAATAVVFVATPAASVGLTAASHVVSARYLTAVLDLTMEAGTHPRGIGHLEDPRSAGELDAVSQMPRDWLFLAGIDATWQLLLIRLSGTGAFLVLLRWSWWAPIALLIGWLIFAGAFKQWSSTLFDELLESTGTDRRRAEYYRSLLTSRDAAKEVRLFDLPGWLLGQYGNAWRRAMRIIWSNRNRGVKVTAAVVVVPLLANAVVFVVLAQQAWHNAVGVGALVTLVQAVLAMDAFGPQTDPQVALARTTSTVARLAQIRVGEGLSAVPNRTGPRPELVRPRGEPAAPAAVEIRGLAFGYPSQPGPAIADLDLRIPAGQSLALVGVNGVGKSTLIKLICGLYRPDAGEILIDGTNPATMPAGGQRISVILQDFVHYQLPMRDNVGFGAPQALDDDLMMQALHDAGGSKLLTRLASGWDTVLSSGYDNGTDLSGGQWQRVALARALFAVRSGAGLLILDEPTASLDVRAEAALFDRLLAVTGGTTTILVSHRLSSVRRVERIVVLADRGDGAAHIVEDGNHEDLLAAGGQYAELFTLQAARFTTGSE